MKEEKDGELDFELEDIKIIIRFDKTAYLNKEDCVYFDLLDKDDNILNPDGDLNSITDDQLFTLGLTLDSILTNVVDNEFEERDEFLEKIKEEIKEMIERCE